MSRSDDSSWVAGDGVPFRHLQVGTRSSADHDLLLFSGPRRKAKAMWDLRCDQERAVRRAVCVVQLAKQRRPGCKINEGPQFGWSFGRVGPRVVSPYGDRRCLETS